MFECFADRADAGSQLAAALHAYAARDDVVVLALPRGGVPVAYPVARALRAPLDVLVVRKLGVPYEPELAMGAIATGGAIHLQYSVIRSLGVTDAQIADVLVRETAELNRREALYRGAWAPLPVEGRVAIVVDDGVATGASMRVALQALRTRHPAWRRPTQRRPQFPPARSSPSWHLHRQQRRLILRSPIQPLQRNHQRFRSHKRLRPG